MGGFFNNVQVRTDTAGREKLIRALRARFEADGLVEASPEGPADRTVVIRGVDDGGWVATYDSLDIAGLEPLAKLLSEAIDGYACSVMVHDDSVLMLELYENGRSVDKFNSAPNYFEDAEPAASTGDPSRWSSVLKPPSTVQDLAARFQERDTFAQDTLTKIAELVGISPDRAIMAYRYLDELPPSPDSLILRYRHTQTPAEYTYVEGPPKLTQDNYGRGRLQCAVGEPLNLSVTARNVGGATKGIRILVGGSAYADGLIEIVGVRFFDKFVLGSGPHQGPDVLHSIFERNDREGSRYGIVELPNTEIPAAIVEPEEDEYEEEDHEAEEDYEDDDEEYEDDDVMSGLELATMFGGSSRETYYLYAQATCRVVKPGRGELNIQLDCLAHPDVAMVNGVDIEASEARWRPIRSLDEPDHIFVRRLSEDNYFMGWGILRVEGRAEQLATIGAALPNIIAAARVKHPLYITGWTGVATTAHGSSEPVERFDFSRLGELLETCRTLSIDAYPFDLRIGINLTGPVLETPALSLVAFTHAEGAQANRTLETLFDVLAAAGYLVQATVSPSGWYPTMDLADSSYERVCGTQGVGADPTWCARWVRWPGRHRLYLDAGLLAHLDRAAINAVAQVVDGPHGSWLTKKENVDRTAWEDALAAVLPSATDAEPNRRPQNK